MLDVYLLPAVSYIALQSTVVGRAKENISIFCLARVETNERERRSERGKKGDDLLIIIIPKRRLL
jgi:hypothetical protein